MTVCVHALSIKLAFVTEDPPTHLRPDFFHKAFCGFALFRNNSAKMRVLFGLKYFVSFYKNWNAGRVVEYFSTVCFFVAG